MSDTIGDIKLDDPNNTEQETNEKRDEANKEQDVQSVTNDSKPRKRVLKIFLISVIVMVVFGLTFQFQARMGELGPVSDIENETVTSIFQKYYLYGGLLFGWLTVLIFLILNIFSRWIGKYKMYYGFAIMALAVLPWYFWSRQLVYFEPRNADYARAIISYLGYPLLATVKFIYILLFIVFILSLLTKVKGIKKAGKISAVMILPFIMTGCLGGSAGIVCWLLPDSDHCYQAAAIQENDPGGCEKIAGEDFEGSNPPKDKCYLRIAENTGDLSVCDNIEGGMFSYTKEECYLETSVKNVNPSGCMMLSGSDKQTCIDGISEKITPGAVLDMDRQIQTLKEELDQNADPELQKQLDGLEKMRSDHLAVMTEENKNEYEQMSDPLNIEVSIDYHSGKIDEKTRDSLIELNNVLRDQGNSMNKKEYEAMRDLLSYKNNPENNIENMDDNEIVKQRWNEKLANGVEFFKFWKANKTTTEEKYDQQLLFYERMMERQQSIDQGLSQAQQDFNREYGRVTDYIKDEVKDKIMDEAKKQAFGALLDLVESDASAPVTAVLGEAIEVVKEEAKSSEFRGLVRAYNKGMEEELGKFGGNVEKAHEEVVKKLSNEPYIYEDSHTFAQYGNLIYNKECDGSNPHCLQKDIFWKAMKKSYKYQQGK